MTRFYCLIMAYKDFYNSNIFTTDFKIMHLLCSLSYQPALGTTAKAYLKLFVYEKNLKVYEREFDNYGYH